jgi:thiol:disulfide interchange protein DsbA
MKLISTLALAVALMACQGEISAQTSGPDEGTYTVLNSPLEPSTGDKIEVMELFWYGCGHCFALEPYVKNWKEKSMPDNVEFVKMPAIFSQRWEFHAKAFYTMEALGVLEQANDEFFHRLHVKRSPINTMGQLVEFLSAYDKSEEEINSAFNSFAVDSKVRNAKIITAKSTAQGVPAVLVDGKYHTSVRLAGSQDNLFKVVNQLVEKAAAER